MFVYHKNTKRIIMTIAALLALAFASCAFAGAEDAKPRAQDDFYTFVNYDWLETAIIPEGSMMASTFDTLSTNAETAVNEILAEIINGDWPHGSPESMAVCFFGGVLARQYPTEADYTPIKPYIDGILNASDLNELTVALANVSRDLALSPIFGVTIAPDAYDKTTYAIYLTVPSFYMLEPSDEEKATEVQRVADLLSDAGIDSPICAERVVETMIGCVRIAGELAQNIGETTDSAAFFMEKPKKYTRDEIDALFPAMNFDDLLAASSFVNEDSWYAAEMGSAIDAWAKYYNEENFDNIKAYAAYNLISECSGMLGSVEGDASMDEAARINAAKLAMQQYAKRLIEKKYVERHFSEQARTNVEAMVAEFIAAYRARIESLDWMTDTTKATAIRKLDSMVVKVGYPYDWNDALDWNEALGVTSVKEGESLFYNDTAYRKAARKLLANRQGKPVDRQIWDDLVTEANAFYRPDNNEIVFPAAILQPPFYYQEAGREVESLAGIGWVIGHEITHAFDNTGAKFDEFGNENNWWSDEDYARFDELCRAVVAHYTGYEIKPGIMTEGSGTLGENIADLGGISCALEIAKVKGLDLRQFFMSAAQLWKCKLDDETLVMQVERDPHSPSKARVNKVLQTFDEFYDMFDVTEGDGMYIPKDKRVKVW